LRNATDEWPSDDVFSRAWMNRNAYALLNNLRITHILGRLSETYRTSKTESVSITAPVSVEHILPQGWVRHWPLPDGSEGMENAWLGDLSEPKVAASQRRDDAVQTFGNLTLITGSLNSSIKNGPWKDKRAEILTHSLLPINGHLHQYERWDEVAIEKRGRELLERALRVWPRSGI
jgi:hypothetical protein